MRELLKAKGFKMTPQRELIFRSFLNMKKHVSMNELYHRVHRKDASVGYATVWRNLKLICKLGLAEEVNLGDGVMRYDRVTDSPHGHLFCYSCKKLFEFDAAQVLDFLNLTAGKHDFEPEVFKIEICGYCAKCRAAESDKKHPDVSSGTSQSTGKAGGTVS